jgi:low affinity Fe/Cu permease
MAAHYQYGHNRHYISDGLRYSEHAKPGGAAIQAKLDELIRVSAARNTLIGIETLTQDEIADIRATRAPKARRAVKGVAGTPADTSR